jgi:hypothetical protein
MGVRIFISLSRTGWRGWKYSGKPVRNSTGSKTFAFDSFLIIESQPFANWMITSTAHWALAQSD